MENIDIYDLEGRTTIIGFREDDIKEYGIINTPDMDRKLKYCARKIKPKQNEFGSLDAIFVLPQLNDVSVIEVKLLFDNQGEFKGNQLMQFTLQGIKKDEYGRYVVYTNRFGLFEYIKDIGENWNFKLGIVCYNKTMELYKKLLE